jgi:outer membrane lipoprotein LolB
MNVKSRLFAIAASALVLSACATQTTKRAPPPVDAAAAERRQTAREDALRLQDDWSLAGRVALSNGKTGGSGRIEWKQDGAKSEVALSAPVTRQSWRLSIDARGARIDGLDGGPRRGADAGALLRETTGWEIPVSSLAYWVRGMRAPGPKPASVRYDAAGRLSHFEQRGWAIDYRWPEGAASGKPASAAMEMPQRIDAAKGDAKVKLIVDEWQARPPTAQAGTAAQALARALAGLNLRDPAADVRANVERGDYRPAGVCGFACLAPGFDQGARGDLRIIDGTGDVVESDEHRRLIGQATAYARSYNQALSAWLKRHPQAAAPARAD